MQFCPCCLARLFGKELANILLNKHFGLVTGLFLAIAWCTVSLVEDQSEEPVQDAVTTESLRSGDHSSCRFRTLRGNRRWTRNQSCLVKHCEGEDQKNEVLGFVKAAL